MRRLLATVVFCGLTSCGGGGGDGNIPYFAGVWDAVVSLTKDECEIDGLDTTLTDVLTINQVDSEITLTNSDGTVEIGNVDGHDSFTATGVTQFNEHCSGSSTTRFTNLNGNQAKASAIFLFDCGGTLKCKIEYKSGSAVRR